MKVWHIGKQQGIKSLVLAETPPPIAGFGEVVIAMKAFALNHRDLLIVNNKYGGPKPENRIPISDGVGEIISVGQNVKKFKIGDLVIPTHFSDWTDGDFDPSFIRNDLGHSSDGLLAERIVLPESCLVKAASSLSIKENATLTVAAATVWSCLQILGKIKAGDTVLTLGTGGVSVFTLQLAKMNGAKVVITSSNNEKLLQMRKLGADYTVNYKENPNWEKIVLKETKGVDIVVETGGIGTLEKSIACCNPNARIGFIGALAGRDKVPNLGGLLFKNIILKGITSGSRKMLEDFITACDANTFRPIIDKVFKFKDTPNAYKYLASESHIGKIVIEL